MTAPPAEMEGKINRAGAMFRGCSALLALIISFALVALPLASSLPAEASVSTPQATWGSIYLSPDAPTRGMAWNGSHLWFATIHGVTELSPSRTATTPPPSTVVNINGVAYPTYFPNWYEPDIATMTFLNGNLFVSGCFGANDYGFAEIDPTTKSVIGFYDLTTIGAAQNPPLNGFISAILGGGFSMGGSLYFMTGQSQLWRFTPGSLSLSGGTGQLTDLTSGTPMDSRVSAVAYDGTKVWLGDVNGGISAYTIEASTQSLPSPAFSASSDPSQRQIISMTTDHSHLWAVALGSPNQVDEVSLANGQLVNSSISLGDDVISVASDGKWVWGAESQNQRQGWLSGFDVSDPTRTTSITLPQPTQGNPANDVFFDGTDLWITEGLDQTVEQLKLYPSAPVITGLSRPTASTASFTFSPPSDPGNSVASALIDITPRSPGLIATEPEPSGTTIDGLQAGVHYCVTVVAENEAGYQTPSAPSCFTTASSTPTTTAATPASLAKTGGNPLAAAVVAATLLAGGAGFRVLRRRRLRLTRAH